MTENKNNKNSNIFRQKNLDRMSSPEDLDRYIKTTTPSLWLLLVSIIIFLLGIIIWSTVSTVTVESESTCNVSKGIITCYITEERVEVLKKDSYIEVNGKNIAIDKLNGPIEATTLDYFAELHNSGIEKGMWYYELTAKCDLADGKYDAKVIFEKISPMTFVTN